MGVLDVDMGEGARRGESEGGRGRYGVEIVKEGMRAIAILIGGKRATATRKSIQAVVK